MNWDGVEVPEELRDLPKGRYVLVAVDDAPELTAKQEAGLMAALSSIEAGRGVVRDEAQKRVNAAIAR